MMIRRPRKMGWKGEGQGDALLRTVVGPTGVKAAGTVGR